jgi:hypothetical protein
MLKMKGPILNIHVFISPSPSLILEGHPGCVPSGVIKDGTGKSPNYMAIEMEKQT